MNYTSRLLKWILRAWPVLLFALVVTVHVFIVMNITGPKDVANANKIAGTILQVLGGLIILISINSNLGLFRRQNLFTTFKVWVSEFPRLRTHHVIHVATGNLVANGATVGLSAYIAGGSLEERIASLERRVDETNARVSAMQKGQNERMDAMNVSLTSSITSAKSELRELASKVEAATVGGFKQQVFGVLIAVYGAFISLVA
jgi:hypothetical protein